MRALKVILGILILTAVAAGGTLAYLARVIAPSHPALTSTVLPRQIPLSDSYAHLHAEWIYSISPDGRLAWHAAGFGVVKVAPYSDLSDVTLIKVGELDDMYWYVGRRLEKFLAEQIGERDGGFDYVEHGQKNLANSE